MRQCCRCSRPQTGRSDSKSQCLHSRVLAWLRATLDSHHTASLRLCPLTAKVTFYWDHEWDPGVPAKPVIRNLLCLAGLEEKPCYLSSSRSWGILDLWPWCSKRYLTQTDDPQEGIVNPDSIDSTFISPPRVSRILETQVALNSVSKLFIARGHAYLS